MRENPTGGEERKRRFCVLNHNQDCNVCTVVNATFKLSVLFFIFPNKNFRFFYNWESEIENGIGGQTKEVEEENERWEGERERERVGEENGKRKKKKGNKMRLLKRILWWLGKDGEYDWSININKIHSKQTFQKRNHSILIYFS